MKGWKGGKRPGGKQGRNLGRHQKTLYGCNGRLLASVGARTPTQAAAGGLRPAPVKNRKRPRTVAVDGSVQVDEQELRVGIKTLWVCALNKPPPEDWGGADGAISYISKQLACTPSTVQRVLERCQEAEEHGEDVDVGVRKAGSGGRNKKIKPGTREGDILVGAISGGFSQKWTAGIINDDPNLSVTVSQKAVQRTKVRFGGVTTKRGKRKTGSKDEDSDWARCRYHLGLQLQAQLRLGKRRRNLSARRWSEAVEEADFPPLYLDGTLFVDEHMEQCVCGEVGHNGAASRSETRFPMRTNAEGKEVLDTQRGTLGPKKPMTQCKKPESASGIFGVGAPTFQQEGGRRSNLKRIGKKMEPLSYTGRIVLGVKEYQKKVAEAMKFARDKKHGDKGGKSPWHDYNGDNPFEERYKATWLQELCKFPLVKKYMCVTDLMDHVIEQGNKMFKGSTHEKDWVIYHDALSQWWEKEAQEHMADKGFADRQVKAQGKTNDTLKEKLSKRGYLRYKDSLMGDSPELMPLDSTLFNDLINSIGHHVCSTWNVTKEQEEAGTKKWSMATPKKAWATMKEVWMGETTSPDSARIIHDIDRFAVAVDEIVKAKGVIVPFLDNRSGHRKAAVRASNGGKLLPGAAQALKVQLETWIGLSGLRK